MMRQSDLDEKAENLFKKWVKRIKIGAIVLGALTPLLGSWYIIDEGYEGVLLRFGQAKYTTGPGLHFKVPLIDGVVKIDTRELTNTEKLAAGANNRLPVTVTMSQTWRIKPGMTLDFYKQYGDRARFEGVILDPRTREVGKAAVSSFSVVELLQQRQMLSAKFDELMSKDLMAYPVVIISSQVEDISFPEDYVAAVREKEKARELAEKESFLLEKQKIEAQQKVNTAEAMAKSTRLEAEAEADKIRMIGVAKANAVDQLNKALGQNPMLVQYERATRWNGVEPTHQFGTAPVPLLNVK